ncbi:MAG: hydroxymethylbilane synthase [Ginsengibacter sp.]
MKPTLKIGTRESELAVWQATRVQILLKETGFSSELIFIKSEGDIDLVTPLYELGVQGIFTKTLDAAILNKRIDIAVHSMKDVPTQLAKGIKQAAVLKRGSYKDILVPHPDLKDVNSIFGMGLIETGNVAISSDGPDIVVTPHTTIDTGPRMDATIATSSIRRIAQWGRRYPNHKIENLRGNVNTRLRKLKESNWHGAIFAAAGLERINLRPANAIELNWMLPAPAQGAIMVVCREDDELAFSSCHSLNHEETALCTKIERDFLSGLMGGCSTPISALAHVKNGEVVFNGEIIDPDSPQLGVAEINGGSPIAQASDMGLKFAEKLLSNSSMQDIIKHIRNKRINR